MGGRLEEFKRLSTLRISKNMINTHIHTFSNKDVPEHFLPLNLVKLVETKFGYKLIKSLLKILDPLTNAQLNRYIKFIDISKLGKQQKIFENIMFQYPKGTEFIVLSIDMSAMGAGKIRNGYLSQLKELSEVAKQYKIYPFVHIDPNNNSYLFNYNYAIHELGFMGVKLYPPASCHLPNDNKLKQIYDLCEIDNIPIISHCSYQSPNHYRGSIKEIKNKLDKACIAYYDKMSKTELCGLFTQPQNYISVLKNYPNTNICLAHWGSEKAWEQYINNPTDKENWFYLIKEMLYQYDNLYTDISFTLSNPEYMSVLKVLLSQDKKIRERVMFGSDYYMVETKCSEKQFIFDLRGYLGEELFQQISNINPKRFLKIK